MIPALIVLVVAIALVAWRITGASGRPNRGFGAHLAVAGFGVVVLAVVVGLIAGNLAGVAFYIAVLVLVAPVTILSWFVKRFYWGSLVGGGLVLLASISVGSFGLGRIDGFTDFAPGLLAVVGALATVAGSVIAISQRSRDARDPATTRQRWTVRGVALVVVSVATLSAVNSARGQTSLGSVPGAIVVDMKDDRFDPTRFRIGSGERVKIIAHNIDDYAHTFTIDDLAIDVYVGPRADRLITFSSPKRYTGQTLALTCEVGGHEDMRGTVTVED